MKHAIIIWLWVSVCNSYWLVGALVRVKGIRWCLVGAGLGGCWSGVCKKMCVLGLYGCLQIILFWIPCEARLFISSNPHLIYFIKKKKKKKKIQRSGRDKINNPTRASNPKI